MRFSLLKYLCFNLIILFILVSQHENLYEFNAAFISSISFWIILLIFPNSIGKDTIFNPGNLTLFIFFLSMVIGPTIAPVLGLRIYWLKKFFAPEFWEYTVLTSSFYSVSFFFYTIGYNLFKQNIRKSERIMIEQPKNWMLITGVIIVSVGILGLVLLTGSFSAAIGLGGLRESAEKVLVAGSFKYVIWMTAVPFGASLIWYYLTQRLKANSIQAILIALICYLPLVPFYIYSSGRGRTIIPLLILIILFDRFYIKVKLKVAIIGILAAIPILATWALYRQGLAINRLDPEQNIGYVLAGDLSRYDISVCAIASFKEGKMDYFLGETFAAGILHTALIPNSLIGGTIALAKVLHRDPNYNKESPYATSLLIESYINFGVIGIIIFSFFIGLFIRYSDGLFYNGEILLIILAISFFIFSPINSSFRISLSRIVWASIFPFLLAKGIKIVISGIFKNQMKTIISTHSPQE